jgi:hypothetical protein
LTQRIVVLWGNSHRTLTYSTSMTDAVASRLNDFWV